MHRRFLLTHHIVIITKISGKLLLNLSGRPVSLELARHTRPNFKKNGKQMG